MSSTSTPASLCIGYAMAYCTTEKVKEVFDYVLGEEIVSEVTALDKTNFKTGRPFKIFFINFKHQSEALTALVKRIEEEEYVKIQYDDKWFWKVTKAIVKENDEKAKPVARIMGRDE
jgi:hypothetical protein